MLNSVGIFHARPDVMVTLAQNCGLHVQSCFRHKELNEPDRIVESGFRYDYVRTV